MIRLDALPDTLSLDDALWQAMDDLWQRSVARIDEGIVVEWGGLLEIGGEHHVFMFLRTEDTPSTANVDKLCTRMNRLFEQAYQTRRSIIAASLIANRTILCPAQRSRPSSRGKSPPLVPTAGGATDRDGSVRLIMRKRRRDATDCEARAYSEQCPEGAEGHNRRGALPPSKWKATSPTRAQAGGCPPWA